MREIVASTLKLSCVSDDQTSDLAFAIYYGKFQASSTKANQIISIIEQRLDQSYEYEQLLNELHQLYLSQRVAVKITCNFILVRTFPIFCFLIQIMSPEVEKAIKDLTGSHKGDHCTLVRSACAFTVHVCQDEHRLFYQFFTKQSDQLM